jgi:diaminohydroxyphosphoribosylaminopyrimidine deaminase/5-amino-6-(5-phosphoribosylamino)uracil reductase
MQEEQEKYMHRCLQLARLGSSLAAPNPMVGSVIVYDGKIIGEGYHHKCGEAHAEVNAINSVKDQELLKKATLYCNLEPCSHVGRTPACSRLIIDKKIPKVVIGCIDSFAKVSGKGVEMMQKAGVDVTVGVLEKESLELNKRFFTFHQKKRPYIILKWAKTRDGFIDHERTDLTPDAAWITNEVSRSIVHKWRTEEAAILVGSQTALKDNPRLNVRAWTGKAPLRVSFDRLATFPKTQHLLDDSTDTIIFTEAEKDNSNFKKTEFVKIVHHKTLVHQILDELYDRDILSVIVEGGKEVLDSFISNDLWDEARVFTGDRVFGKGTKAPEFDFPISKTEQLGNTQLDYIYSNL